MTSSSLQPALPVNLPPFSRNCPVFCPIDLKLPLCAAGVSWRWRRRPATNEGGSSKRGRQKSEGMTKISPMFLLRSLCCYVPTLLSNAVIEFALLRQKILSRSSSEDAMIKLKHTPTTFRKGLTHRAWSWHEFGALWWISHGPWVIGKFLTSYITTFIYGCSWKGDKCRNLIS